MSVSPQNWSKEALKRRVRFAYGDSLASENRNDGDVPVFGSNGVVGAHDRSITRAPAIVIGRKGSSGRVTWSDVPCFPIDTTYFVDRTQTRENMRWLFYALESLELDKINFDSAVPGLSRELAYSLPLVFPPLPEQRLIAAYLDASCAAIDAAVAAKRRQVETLDALRTTLVYEAVTQGINRSATTVVHDIPSYGHTPKHWKRSKLRYEISIQNGDFASDKLQDDGAHPVLGGNGVMGHTDLSNVDGETVVIGRVGAYCGNAHYVRSKAWVSDNALIVKTRHHARFLCHLFNALNFNAQANNTAQPVITGTKIKNTYVVLPPPVEQETICAFLDAKLAEVKRIVTGIESQIATLIAYRKSLIHEFVTGQRRVTEVDVARVLRGESESMRPNR